MPGLAQQGGTIPDSDGVSDETSRPDVRGMRALGSEHPRVHEQAVEEDRNRHLPKL